MMYVFFMLNYMKVYSMITYYSEKTIELRGLSTDVKPTDYICNGSVFFEMDTSKAFVFNEENSE